MAARSNTRTSAPGQCQPSANGTLGQRDLTLVSKAIGAAAPDWSVELHCICSGEANLVIMPEDADDALGPTFIIRREGGALCLDQFHWNDYSQIGSFVHLRDAVAVVRTHIRGLASVTPVSRMRH
jgi:hypothetical protein